ncbi:glycoside hydrolase family 127 protein [Streptomyces sp. FXJ1.4098]|nr:glycoside hydrolase family 127 protein [Streptomyces sp. FXJ1.4098]
MEPAAAAGHRRGALRRSGRAHPVQRLRGGPLAGRTEVLQGNPLQRRPDHAEAVGDPRSRDEWFYSACCPPSVTRLVASLPHYAATTAGDTLFLHLYAPMALSCAHAGGTVGLRIDTDYPWHGTVTVAVEHAPADEWALGLRIPPWSTRTWLTEPGGVREPVVGDVQGRVVVRRRWRAGSGWCWSWTWRRGSPCRIRGSTRCAAVRRSSGGRWCTASSSWTSPRTRWWTSWRCAPTPRCGCGTRRTCRVLAVR